jgi:hypothetical protein
MTEVERIAGYLEDYADDNNEYKASAMLRKLQAENEALRVSVATLTAMVESLSNLRPRRTP